MRRATVFFRYAFACAALFAATGALVRCVAGEASTRFSNALEEPPGALVLLAEPAVGTVVDLPCRLARRGDDLAVLAGGCALRAYLGGGDPAAEAGGDYLAVETTETRRGGRDGTLHRFERVGRKGSGMLLFIAPLETGTSLIVQAKWLHESGERVAQAFLESLFDPAAEDAPAGVRFLPELWLHSAPVSALRGGEFELPLARLRARVLDNLLDTGAEARLRDLLAVRTEARTEALDRLVAGLGALLDGREVSARSRLAPVAGWFSARALMEADWPGGWEAFASRFALDGVESVRTEACRTCGGTGRADCPSCNGSRHWPCPRCKGVGAIRQRQSYRTCPTCRGLGAVECRICHGRGWVPCEACGGEDLSLDAGPASSLGTSEARLLEVLLEKARYLRAGGVDLVRPDRFETAPAAVRY